MQNHELDLLISELDILSKPLNRENIVSFFGYYFDENECYLNLNLIMEYLHWNLNKAILSMNDETTLKTKLEISYKIIRGLNELHKNKIYHLDLTPNNVLLSEDLKIVKLVDFGLSKVVSSHSKLTTNKGGTPHYMSPEQYREHKANAKSDIYSFGILFYFLFTKETPWSNLTMFQIATKFTNELTPITDGLNLDILPSLNGLREIVEKCLCFDFKERPSAEKLLQIYQDI